MPLFARGSVETAVPGVANTDSDADEILRFRAAERHLHWAIAVPFKVCYLTAVILVLVYNPHPNRPFRELVSWLHRLSGVCLSVLPPLMIVRHRRDFRLHLYNIRQGWSWRLDDLKWLLLMPPATAFKSIELPHQGKFNAGEKINFMAVMATYPVYIATGLLIWFSSAPSLSLARSFLHSLARDALDPGPYLHGHRQPRHARGPHGDADGLRRPQVGETHYRLWYDEHYGHRPEQPSPAVPESGPATEPVHYPAPMVDRQVVPRMWPREPSPRVAAAPGSTFAPGSGDLPAVAASGDVEDILDKPGPGSVKTGSGAVPGTAMAS